MKSGMIGLGAMGAHMARNMAKKGFLAAVWNRNREKAEALAAEIGIDSAETPADLARRVEVIVTCVSADADVLEMINAVLPALSAGKTVVDMSTVSSETAKQAAALLAEKGAKFLDAPVSGGVEGAKNATLAVMVGGDEAVLHQARPVLESMAGRIMHMGGVGAGQGTKAVNQVMAAGINQAVTEALAFGQVQGLPMDKLIDVLSGGAAGNWFLEHRGPTMTQGTFAPGFKLALHHKDLRICKAMAEKTGITLPLVNATLRDYETLMQQGHGDEDISALYRLKRP
ncbi:MAG: NAD(P)-dependent oxidoreductase [Pseudomonadota bacterium]